MAINNTHCIPWDDGVIPLDQFENILKTVTATADNILVKSGEVRDILEGYTTKPIYVIKYEPHLLLKDVASCYYHTPGKKVVCALTNVFKLHGHFIALLDSWK